MNEQHKHESVLLDEAIEGLNIQGSGTYVDLTYGRGGHSQKILKQLNAMGRLVVMDKDVTAINHARNGIGLDARVAVVHSDFSSLRKRLSDLSIKHVHGVLIDLGVSSPQLDVSERGFSFQNVGPLDMRMNVSEGETAQEWLQVVDEGVLSKVIWTLGEERYARRIARAIVRQRQLEMIEDTETLAELVRNAIPKKIPGKDAATRTFQAIRMHINGELDALNSVMGQAVECLMPCGRFAVISFHSLEDRIVKSFFREAIQGAVLPSEIPYQKEMHKPRLRYISKRIRASEAELKRNPRARSAVLRIVEKQ